MILLIFNSFYKKNANYFHINDSVKFKKSENVKIQIINPYYIKNAKQLSDLESCCQSDENYLCENFDLNCLYNVYLMRSKLEILTNFMLLAKITT